MSLVQGIVWRCQVCGARTWKRHTHCRVCGTHRDDIQPFPSPRDLQAETGTKE